MTHSPPEKRIRPAANGTDSKSLAGDKPILTPTSMVVEDSPLVQMRRRQSAAKRLPPLADGRRDPWQFVPRDGRSIA